MKSTTKKKSPAVGRSAKSRKNAPSATVAPEKTSLDKVGEAVAADRHLLLKYTAPSVDILDDGSPDDGGTYLWEAKKKASIHVRSGILQALAALEAADRFLLIHTALHGIGQVSK